MWQPHSTALSLPKGSQREAPDPFLNLHLEPFSPSQRHSLAPVWSWTWISRRSVGVSLRPATRETAWFSRVAFVLTSLLPQPHHHIRLNPPPFSFPRGKEPGFPSSIFFPGTRASDAQPKSSWPLSMMLERNDDWGVGWVSSHYGAVCN